jgi:hypothetical protein
MRKQSFIITLEMGAKLSLDLAVSANAFEQTLVQHFKSWHCTAVPALQVGSKEKGATLEQCCLKYVKYVTPPAGLLKP